MKRVPGPVSIPRRIPCVAGLCLVAFAVAKTVHNSCSDSTNRAARSAAKRALTTATAAAASSSGSSAGAMAEGRQPSTGMTRLLTKLIDRGTLRTPAVAQVMASVDRAAFVPALWDSSLRAYEDHPLPIGYGQTISAPHMHATALELLSHQLRPGARVLDVGSGSGYLTACMGLMVSPGGRVVGVEVVPELAERSVLSLQEVVPELMRDGTIRIESGNVLSGLLATEAPFDAIHVGAAAEQLPRDLVARLAPGGRMVVPVGPHYFTQVLTVVDKAPAGPHGPRGLAPQGPGEAAAEAGGGEGGWGHGGIRVTKLMDVGYVPLVPDTGAAGGGGGGDGGGGGGGRPGAAD